jgi:hypothetical protein
MEKGSRKRGMFSVERTAWNRGTQRNSEQYWAHYMQKQERTNSTNTKDKGTNNLKKEQTKHRTHTKDK